MDEASCHTALKRAGLAKRGSCHLFRHTKATLMHEAGADIRHIQALLGHCRLNTTQIYTRVSINNLREVHEKTHPAKFPRKSKEERGPKSRDKSPEPEGTDGESSQDDQPQRDADAR